MHDPRIVAFEIKYPWWRHKPWPKKHQHDRHKSFIWKNRLTAQERLGRDSFWDCGYRETFITIWHVDPEKDGLDDSCGWSYPKLQNWQTDRLWNGAWGEGRTPHFLAFNGKTWEGASDEAVSLYEGLIYLTARLLKLKLSFDYIHKMAVGRIHTPDCCNPTGVFCFQPGYHTNNPKDSTEARQEHFYGILCSISRCILSDLRPWYRHPKWHFWHWKFQIHPLQNLKRRFWDKCCECGKRGFPKGQSAMSDWNCTRIWHDGCDKSSKHPVLKQT